MPTWRVSQCLPPTVAAFDLVVLDEASQSDITALPALLRGAQVLVVGDGKQVSPSAAFVSEGRIADLKAGLLTSRHPYVEQLLPGRSIFDLAQTCYADARVALRQHFRCVPGCIAFSNSRFYHGRLQPCRLPPRSQRLDPPLLDFVVPGGSRSAKTKTNEKEARALVHYLRQQLAEPAGELRGATVGIISLSGLEQARLLRSLLLDSLTDAQLARHRIVVGDASSFQGDERDVILLSMVASAGSAPPQIGRLYEQKYNVALSRARDRMVLFRSVQPKDVPNADDLKRWTISFFQQGGAPPPPAVPARASGAGGAALTPEGQLQRWLSEQGYRYDAECSVAGSAVVAEDAHDDRRLCICLDGGAGSTLGEWRAAMREQRSLERAGWRFCRIWRASWLVDQPRALKELSRALDEAGVRPAQPGASEQPAPRGPASSATAPLEPPAVPAPRAPAVKVPRSRPVAGAQQPRADTAASSKKRKATATAPHIIELDGAGDGGADIPMLPSSRSLDASPSSAPKAPRTTNNARKAQTATATTSKKATTVQKPKVKGKRMEDSDSDWEP